MMWNHNFTDSFFYHFVWSPSSFGPNTHWFLGRRPFFGLHILLDQNATYLAAKTFFGLHLFLDRKRVPPSLATPLLGFDSKFSPTRLKTTFIRIWYRNYIYSPSVLGRRQRRNLLIFESSCYKPTCQPHMVKASHCSFLMLNIMQGSCEYHFL